MRNYIKTKIALLTLPLVLCACASKQVQFDNPESKKVVVENGSEIYVPYKQLTKAPGAHWFAYYDKFETDPTGRYVLAMRADFENRSPKDFESIEIGVIDTFSDNKWTTLGKSSAWGWQQGCQLQFIPQSDSEVLWNDLENGTFVTRIKNIKTGKMRTIDTAVYALSPDGKWAVTLDYARLNDTRPGYGYKGVADPYKDVKAPKETGIWKVDLQTGERKLIMSLADVVALKETKHINFCNSKHWLNHLLVSPNGKRFIFFHRWQCTPDCKNKCYYAKHWGTHMLTANVDGSDIRVVIPYKMASHFIWDWESKNILAWTNIANRGNAFYLISDEPKPTYTKVGPDKMNVNGHCTYLKNPDWILNDTYPDRNGMQTVFLYNVKTGKRIDIAKLFSPRNIKGKEWRCDTHPRATPDGSKVIVDSAHSGSRQIYMFDISSLIK